MEDQRQEDGRREARPRARASGRGPSARPRSVATSAARRQVSTATRVPPRIEDHWAAANVVPRSVIGTAARSDGSGSQTSKAGRGNSSGGVPKLQMAFGDQARAVDQVSGHAHVVGGVLGSSEGDETGSPDADREGHDRDEEDGQPGFASGHRGSRGRCSPGSGRVINGFRSAYRPARCRRRTAEGAGSGRRH